MKISLKWLQDYIDIKEFLTRPEELARLLTHAGLEIENIERESEPWRHVFVGCVNVLEKHPHADRLTLCQVDVGGGQFSPREPSRGENSLRQIICGAKNHKVGDKVVVALPGAELPGGLSIKKSKIRGVESHGMMCSDSELGLEASEGIKILPCEAPVGISYAQYAGWDDIILELSVTPNRADCLSHLGLARELGCLLDRSVRRSSCDLTLHRHSTREAIGLELKDSVRCPRYAGRRIRGVKVGESPQWMRSRLEAVGIHSVNNIVDVTNYVMLELGQPLHAFDMRFIEDQKIIVDGGVRGEKFIPLNGQELELTGEELTIRDGKKVLALAGVIGGVSSAVEESTTDIFIESAHFVPKTIRQTSRRLGIHTDSSYRFCRGTDPQSVELALRRACYLMEKVAGGEVSEDFYDEFPKAVESPAILVRHQILEERLGYTVSSGEFRSWMKRLGCELVGAQGEGTTLLQAPTYRWDLNMEIDFVEELARLQGYNKIPERLPALVNPPTDHAHPYKIERTLVGWMREQGYFQAVNYHFIGEKFLRDFLGDVSKLTPCGFSLDPDPILINNPMSEDSNAMRTSLLPGLLKNMLSNSRYGVKYGRLFELGPTFGCLRGGTTQKDSDQEEEKGAEESSWAQSAAGKSFVEMSHLSLIAWGQRDTLWSSAAERPVIYDLKSSVESLFLRMKSSTFQWRDLKEAPEFLHPGQWSGLFLEGQMSGFIGTLHPALKEEHKLRHDVAVGEFLLQPFMRGQPRKPRLQELSKYPPVERDFAFIVPDTLKVGDVIRQIKKSAGGELRSVHVFDDYRGKGVDQGHHSVAFKLFYQGQEGTLSEAHISELQESLIQTITQRLPIRVRSPDK